MWRSQVPGGGRGVGAKKRLLKRAGLFFLFSLRLYHTHCFRKSPDLTRLDLVLQYFYCTCTGDVAQVDINGIPLHVGQQSAGLAGSVVERPLHVQVGVHAQHVQPEGPCPVVEGADGGTGAGRLGRESNRGQVEYGPPISHGRVYRQLK